jgi:probable blue pigment (indigoidine) exporter
VKGRLSDAGLAALAPAVWGSTYLVTTQLLPPDRALLAATIRALPSGLLLILFTRAVPRGHWIWRAVCLGLFNIGAFFALLFVAAYRLPGGVAAFVGSVQPLFVLGLAALLLRERAGPREGAACVVGLLGVGLLVSASTDRLDPVGVAAALGAAGCMATGIVLTKRWGRPVGLLAFTGWQLAAGGLLLLPAALVLEGLPSQLTGRNLAGYGYLCVIGAVLSYALWFRGVERLPAVAVSLLGLLSPVVAALLGLIVLGQTLTPLQLLGAAAVLAGIVLAQLPARTSDRKEDSDNDSDTGRHHPGGEPDVPNGERLPGGDSRRPLAGR